MCWLRPQVLLIRGLLLKRSLWMRKFQSEYKLDGIVTLVDAAHIDQQLGRSDESTEQIAFADVLVLNKSDLVTDDSMDNLEVRLRDMNRMARVVRTENANIPVDTVLNLAAFDLDQVLERRPTFLEPEYPFEWTGVYSLESGSYELSLAEGPDPAMSLVVLAGQSTEDAALKRVLNFALDVMQSQPCRNPQVMHCQWACMLTCSFKHRAARHSSLLLMSQLKLDFMPSTRPRDSICSLFHQMD